MKIFSALLANADRDYNRQSRSYCMKSTCPVTRLTRHYAPAARTLVIFERAFSCAAEAFCRGIRRCTVEQFVPPNPDLQQGQRCLYLFVSSTDVIRIACMDALGRSCEQ
jgi:hypothetical protein